MPKDAVSHPRTDTTSTLLQKLKNLQELQLLLSIYSMLCHS